MHTWQARCASNARAVPRRGQRRALASLLPALLVLACALVPVPRAAAQQPAASGVLVTLSATAENLEPLTPGELVGGLVIRLTLENRTNADVADLRVTAPIPAQTRVTDSWRGSPGQGAGTMDGSSVVWSGLAVAGGAQLGPLAYRVVPGDGADGAVIFREARVQPDVAWTRPSAGRATPPVLALNGLWGEGGLRRTVLPSLLTVFTRERPDTASVALVLAVRAGSRDETEVTRGGSHWLEHAYFLGTPSRPGNQAIFGAIMRTGGAINASTNPEYTNYLMLVSTDQFEVALDVMADQLVNSTFAREGFDRERSVVFEELRSLLDNPQFRNSVEFQRLVFLVSPLRQDAAGTIESVQNVPIDTILAYNRERYVTGNMAVAAIGQLRHDEAVAAIARAFAGLARGSRGDRPGVHEPAQTQPRRLEIGQGAELAWLTLGWPGPGYDNPDWASMLVLESVLGESGQRLEEEVVERRGLVPSVNDTYQAFSDAGYYSVAVTVPVPMVDQATAAILAEVQRVRDGDLSLDDLQASVRAIAGRGVRPLRSNVAPNLLQAIELSADDVAEVLQSDEESLARLRAATPADVQRVARTYLDPASYTLVVVRP